VGNFGEQKWGISTSVINGTMCFPASSRYFSTVAGPCRPSPNVSQSSTTCCTVVSAATWFETVFGVADHGTEPSLGLSLRSP